MNKLLLILLIAGTKLCFSQELSMEVVINQESQDSIITCTGNSDTIYYCFSYLSSEIIDEKIKIANKSIAFGTIQPLNLNERLVRLYFKDDMLNPVELEKLNNFLLKSNRYLKTSHNIIPLILRSDFEYSSYKSLEFGLGDLNFLIDNFGYIIE